MGKLIVFYLGLWITLYLIGFDFRFKFLSFEDLFSRFNQSGDNFEPEPEKCVEGPTDRGYNFCIKNN